MTSIIPIYSIYVDTRNGYSIGLHKIRLRADQIITLPATYTWDVPRLAPGTYVGAHLSLLGQFPNMASMTNGGGVNRSTVSAYVGASARTRYPKNSDGSVDLIYTTIHQGAINNTNRT